MIGPSVPCSVARVTAVNVDLEKAVFLDVDLLYQSTDQGVSVSATCRWCSPYAGPDYGSFHVPQEGDLVLCIFPGVGIEGGIGGDLDDGYAWAHVPGSDRKMPEGLEGSLAGDRRVEKGRPGEALDQHVQGDLALTVDGDRNLTVESSESHETKGTMSWLLRGIASFVSDVAMSIVSQTTLALTGTDLVALSSATSITLVAPSIGLTSSSGSVVITADAFQVVSASLELGAGAGQRFLLTEDAIQFFNTHDHGAPVGPVRPEFHWVVGTHTTQNTKAS